MPLIDPKTGDELTPEQEEWLYGNAQPVTAKDEQRIAEALSKLEELADAAQEGQVQQGG